ncbi:MAG: glycosyl hydrolase [Steroidobacteraceae bacterium]
MKTLFLAPLASASLLLVPVSLPAAAAVIGEKKPKEFGALEYRLIGPAVAGRATAVAGVPGNPLVFYASAAQGGLWKSVDGGREWQPLFDEELTQSIGSFALAPSDPNVIYVGSGEANPRGNVAIGLGIWKSIDAGATWQQVLKLRGQLGQTIVHPTNPDIAFAAVLGSPFGPSDTRGVYRTVDGGKNWQRVLFKNTDTGASDIAFDPNNPNILFAGLWQFRRTPWSATSGGPGSGLWRSADGGTTWTQLTGSGLPDGDWGKVGVAIAPSDSNRVYALIEAEEGGLFRSDNAGAKWERINSHRALRQRHWYYTTFTIDPTNADVIWFPQVPLLKSIDGGKTVSRIRGPHHGDHHDIWIDPKQPQRMIDGNDGGIDMSFDGGRSWFDAPLPTGQFYNLDVDDRVPYHVGGTMQDWGTASGPSRSLASPGMGAGRRGEANALADWLVVGGGEAGDFVYDRSQPGGIFAGEYSGIISYYREGTGQNRMISADPESSSGRPADKLKYRFQWTAPIAASPHDPKVVYHGANVLFRTRDRGASWQAISGDLTRNDRSKQQWSGGPITGDLTGVETYGTIFSIAEAYAAAGQIWIGSDDGLLHVTRDDGASWSDVTPKGVAVDTTIESIEPSRRDAGTAYVVAQRYRLDDFRPYLYRTRDYGKTWQSLTEGLPTDLPLWVVREDPADPDYLYLGTDRGIWFSSDAGQHWRELRLNLPAVTVTDLEAKHGDLVVATRGRAIWVLEDVAALRAQKTRPNASGILSVEDAYRFRSDRRWDYPAPGKISNQPYGALISYWLAEEPKGKLELLIADAAGQLVRTLSSEIKPPKYPKDDPDDPAGEPKPDLTTDVGFNRLNWDLRVEGSKRLPAKTESTGPETGPLAPPGTYSLTLRGAGADSQATVVIEPDPRAPVMPDEVRQNVAFSLDLRDAFDALVENVAEIAAIRTQVGDLRSRLGDDAGVTDLRGTANRVLAACDTIEGTLHNPKAQVSYDVLAGRDGGAKLYSQLTFLYDSNDSSDYPPAQGLREQFAAVAAELKQREDELAALQNGDLVLF